MPFIQSTSKTLTASSDGLMLAARAGDQQQVARLIGPQEVGIGRYRLDDALHLGRSYILQRNHLRADAGQAAGVGALCPQRRSGNRVARRHYAVDALLDDDRRAFAPQDDLEDLQQASPWVSPWSFGW